VVFGKVEKIAGELDQEEREIIENIERKRDELRELEDKLKGLREKRRELNMVVGGIQESIQRMLGLIKISKVSGAPVRRVGSGKGQKVYIRTTEKGLKEGLVNIAGEFESMAKALYALFPSLEGKRTDFKARLQSLANKGLIELEFY
jgi:hypothetical protein